MTTMTSKRFEKLVKFTHKITLEVHKRIFFNTVVLGAELINFINGVILVKISNCLRGVRKLMSPKLIFAHPGIHLGRLILVATVAKIMQDQVVLII